MKNLIFTLIVGLLGLSASAGDIMEGFDSLGGNKDLYNKAKALHPETEIKIVQGRTVSRKFRHEFSPQVASFVGGDAYLSTDTLGLTYHFHINHRWSVGLNYFYAFNSLTSEAKALISNGLQPKLTEPLVPDLDEPRQGYLATVNWYPIYGKMSLYDLGITQFDLYLTAGTGVMELSSKGTGTYTYGGGLGVWFSQHLTGRMELRRQVYDTERFTGKHTMNLTVLGLSLGYML
ncbi:MAG: outer membrane beta-barrel domain-containing protein [Bdellovibrionaceae bacterium]|nr:outer membrane beta-barrel domain-containing protein [Bdellovibrionales bacterium]MCB9085688.1 outer membrane beta-barrel domain-containing protein [Pseudobdellovibrionaceae bacterium]